MDAKEGHRVLHNYQPISESSRDLCFDDANDLKTIEITEEGGQL